MMTALLLVPSLYDTMYYVAVLMTALLLVPSLYDTMYYVAV
jgi:hypothetical protein